MQKYDNSGNAGPRCMERLSRTRLGHWAYKCSWCAVEYGLSIPGLGLDVCVFTLSLPLKKILKKEKRKNKKKKKKEEIILYVDYVICPLFY